MGGRAGGGASGGMGSGSRSARAVAEAEKELGFSLKGMSKEDKDFWIKAANDQKAWKKDFADRTSQPRTPITKGSEGYKAAQKMANLLEGHANGDFIRATGKNSWSQDDRDKSAQILKFATDHITKHGNDFEKSVAASVAKTIKTGGKTWGKVAFVSNKQAWVLGKSLSETHVKIDDFPF